LLGQEAIDAMVAYAQRPETQANAERQREKMAPARLAQRVARGDADDEVARVVLRQELTVEREALDTSVNYLASLRVDYVTDRAFRLLSAARDDEPVRPIDPVARDQFLSESRLGRMPLKDAFEYLVSVKPELQQLADSAISRGQGPAFSLTDRGVLGPGARNSEPVLNTDFAVNLANDYVMQSQREMSLPGQDITTPFFERQNLSHARSFFPLGLGGSRPRARNWDRCSAPLYSSTSSATGPDRPAAMKATVRRVRRAIGSADFSRYEDCSARMSAQTSTHSLHIATAGVGPATIDATALRRFPQNEQVSSEGRSECPSGRGPNPDVQPLAPIIDEASEDDPCLHLDRDACR
jgi:hypothetical protein